MITMYMLSLIWINWEKSHIWCAPTDLWYFYHNTDTRIPKWNRVQNNLFKVLFHFVKVGCGLCQAWTTEDCVYRETDERFAHLHNTDAIYGFLRCWGTVSRHRPKREVRNFGRIASLWCWWTAAMEHIMDCRMLLSGRANMTIWRSEEILELIVQYENEDVFHNISNI